MWAAILAFVETSKKTIYIVLAAMAAVYVVVTIGYYLWSQNEIQKLAASNATIAIEKSQLTASNDALTFDAQRLKENTDRLNGELEAARAQAADAIRRLLKHDLGAIAQKKPGLLENQVNQAIHDYNQRLMELSRQ